MRVHSRAWAIGLLTCLVGQQAQAAGGCSGVVVDRAAGVRIAGAALSFVPETSGSTRRALSDANGSYRVTLPAGRYTMEAQQVDYDDYSSRPGFVVIGSRLSVCNVFLNAQRVTTVLLVRHAEPDYSVDVNDPPLAPAGVARAQALLHAAVKARPGAVFATSLKRTQQTVKPLADALGLVPQIDDSPASVAARILGGLRGQTVLVAGHQPSVPQIVQALGGRAADCVIGDEFDNLCVVTVYRSGRAKTVNLQYGS